MSTPWKALNTTEILENILLLLPHKELFVLQRVSTTWRNVINSSKIASILFINVPKDESIWAQPDFEWNPLLLKHDCRWRSRYAPSPWCCRVVDTRDLERLAGDCSSTSRQLYLTKPARKCVRISSTNTAVAWRPTRPRSIGRTMTNMEGVRLGDLVDLGTTSDLSFPCNVCPSGVRYFNVCVSGGLDWHSLSKGVEIGYTGDIRITRKRGQPNSRVNITGSDVSTSTSPSMM